MGIMKKKELNIDGLYKIKKEDLKRCAEVAAHAFIDDESSKFLFSSKLSYEALYDYYLLLYKAAYSKMHMFAESEKINGFAIVAPIKNSELSPWDCIKTGGLKTMLSMGFGVILRSLEYENHCIKIRSKIIQPNTWYIFQFGVSPDKQGQGLGSKIMKPILNWLDSEKIACYLETNKASNVNIYNHLGFSLKDITTLPKKKVNQFAMLRG